MLEAKGPVPCDLHPELHSKTHSTTGQDPSQLKPGLCGRSRTRPRRSAYCGLGYNSGSNSLRPEALRVLSRRPAPVAPAFHTNALGI